METTPSYDDFFALIHKTELTLNDFAQANSTELRDYSPTKVYAKTPPLIQTKYTATKNNTLVISQKCVKFFLLFLSPWSMSQKKRLSMYCVSPPLPAQSNAALGTRCKDNIYLVIFKGHCRRM